MNLPGRFGSEQRRAVGPSAEEAGSLLVEALVGIGLLGLVTAAVASLLPAVLEADARSRAHRAALIVGDALLEAAAADITGTTVEVLGSVDGVRIVRDGSDVEEDEQSFTLLPSGCDGSDRASRRVTSIDVEHGARTEGREVVLQSGLRSASVAPDGRNDLSIRLSEGWGAQDLILIDANGAMAHDETAESDCMSFRDLPLGTSWIAAAGPGVWVDRVHVPLTQRRLPVTLAGRPHARTVDLAPAGWLRVDVDHRGARPPDHVSTGALRWFLRDDDANLGLEPGLSRAVHPGIATAVVAPCHDSTTTGSTTVGLISPGEETSIEIALAVVTITNIREHHDAWLQVQRVAECADGTRLRPVLRFEGDLHDGMRIALPRGRWDAWLRRPGSSPLTGSVRFSAADAEAIVRIP